MDQFNLIKGISDQGNHFEHNISRPFCGMGLHLEHPLQSSMTKDDKFFLIFMLHFGLIKLSCSILDDDDNLF